jgi:hypothetical protein
MVTLLYVFAGLCGWVFIFLHYDRTHGSLNGIHYSSPVSGYILIFVGVRALWHCGTDGTFTLGK